MEKQKNGVYTYCRKSTQYSTWSRQCFMTGEQCSKQSIVHKERERLHRNKEINAFVVMNFSEMSDVVYKWKLSSFIESLKDHLYLNNNTDEIICVADTKDDPNTLENIEQGWTKVSKIHVVRADSNTVSNYIICNRVCQQMQIADLVIVDVSVENTNVFYEFGMAVAFGKLILPICYNESFYQFSMPEGAKECLEKRRKEYEKLPKEADKAKKKTELEEFRRMVEHHIDCYPWRRKLFEYYGIRYRSKDSHVGYTIFQDIINPLYNYSDTKYNQFPYDAKINRINGNLLDDELYKQLSDEDEKRLGEEKRKQEEAKARNENYVITYKPVAERVGSLLYSRLGDSYGNGTISGKYNTVLIYTMDKILNAEQAGQCIINYYQNMTSQIWEEFCFRGDRVGVMGQANAIPDDPKDTKTDQKLLYRVGDIIRIGMNEATHLAQKQRIKTSDYLLGNREIIPENDYPLMPPEEWNNTALRFTKEYVRNRCIPIYPDEPIYVQELLHGVQRGILSDDLLEKKKYDYKHFFCLFHVTLHTLRYTNEIVVDLSHNSLQALFWLGVAHGRNTQAITVRHIPTTEELRLTGTTELPTERNIFDVAGLWTAILHSNNTNGFYHQLAMAQIGIEQYSKLALPEAEIEQYKEAVLDEFYETSPYMKFGYERITQRISNLDKRHKANNLDKRHKANNQGEQDYLELRDILSQLYSNERMKHIWKTLADRNRKESERLESYYRSLFWRRMLRYNELQLYTPQRDGHDSETREPKRISITWDMDAAAELSHYLSKRNTIGRYRIHSLQQGKTAEEAQKSNFICIGGEAVPMAVPGKGGLPLVKHIRDNINEESVVRHLAYGETRCKFTRKETRGYRGVFSEDGKNNVFAPFVNAYCTGNLISGKQKKIIKRCKHFSLDNPGEFVPVNKYFMPAKLTGTWETTGKGSFNLPENFADPCQLCQNRNDKYEQLAQLILWREVPKNRTDQKEKVKYWVSLIGVSGPATLALTSLLVDDQQKKELLPEKRGKAAALPLNNIQTHIRKTLMDHYDIALKKQFKKREIPLPEKNDLLNRVCHATKLYLSTVLYQYFFPFLSLADEEEICNGMKAYVSSIGFLDMFENEPHKLIEEAVTNALQETISGIRGVEALYRVEVKYGTDDMDDRSPQDIHLLRRDNSTNDGTKGDPVISCLFAKSPSK